ncbi:MAG: hypothetical protein ACREVL_12795 [Solimonas sp.]
MRTELLLTLPQIRRTAARRVVVRRPGFAERTAFGMALAGIAIGGIGIARALWAV